MRQRWARSLVEEYGYPNSNLGIEVKINMGRSRKRADLALYRHDAPHKQENILILIEAKRDDRKPSDIEQGEDQLKSYMAACIACRFGLWVGKERQAFEKSSQGYDRISDIPRFGADQPQPPTRHALVPATELKSVFKRCHNYIYANTGVQKEAAFHELLKLIFCKTFDEEESGTNLQFIIHPQERKATSGQRRFMEERLEPLFQRVCDRYPFIFNSEDRIKLEQRVAAYVASELQYFSFIDTDTDVKGDAYEELVGSNLRGDRGEYFTPRNVCNMAVRMAMALHDTTALTSLKVLDCCCGTGGFLVSWLNNLYDVLLSQESTRPGKVQPEERARRRVRDVCQRNLYGLDINPDLVRTCQMNMVLHGDGSSNVYRVDSVRSPGEWDSEARRRVPYGRIDVLITNPPFGGKARIDDSHVLGQHELAKWEIQDSRSSLPAEQLFVETALKFLKAGGYLVIVLPNGILNNPGLRFLRSWLLRRCRLIASVALPKTTFATSGGVKNPSVLIVQKFSAREASDADKGIIDKAYQVFCAAPKTAGIDSRSKPVYLRHLDGREKLDDDGNKIVDDEISFVPEEFTKWVESSI